MGRLYADRDAFLNQEYVLADQAFVCPMEYVGIAGIFIGTPRGHGNGTDSMLSGSNTFTVRMTALSSTRTTVLSSVWTTEPSSVWTTEPSSREEGRLEVPASRGHRGEVRPHGTRSRFALFLYKCPSIASAQECQIAAAAVLGELDLVVNATSTGADDPLGCFATGTTGRYQYLIFNATGGAPTGNAAGRSVICKRKPVVLLGERRCFAETCEWSAGYVLKSTLPPDFVCPGDACSRADCWEEAGKCNAQSRVSCTPRAGKALHGTLPCQSSSRSQRGTISGARGLGSP